MSNNNIIYSMGVKEPPLEYQVIQYLLSEGNPRKTWDKLTLLQKRLMVNAIKTDHNVFKLITGIDTDVFKLITGINTDE